MGKKTLLNEYLTSKKEYEENKTMNLSKLFEMQKELDQHIRKEKGLEGRNLIPNTYVALQVELSEMANEHQWFKHWKDNNEPRDFVPNPDDICESCNGNPIFFEDEKIVGQCNNCDGCGVHFHNPLLEEYVDSLHFFLSLAIQNKWGGALYIYEEQLCVDELDGGLSEWYLEMLYFINKSYFENPDEEFNEKWEKTFGLPAKQYWFRTAWILFLNIGLHGFGFTLDQIEQAYFEKNKVNHERQENGY